MTTSLRWRTHSVQTKIFPQSQPSQTQLRRIFPIDNNARIERMWHLITTIASPPKQDQAGGSHQLTIMVDTEIFLGDNAGKQIKEKKKKKKKKEKETHYLLFLSGIKKSKSNNNRSTVPIYSRSFFLSLLISRYCEDTVSFQAPSIDLLLPLSKSNLLLPSSSSNSVCFPPCDS